MILFSITQTQLDLFSSLAVNSDSGLQIWKSREYPMHPYNKTVVKLSGEAEKDSPRVLEYKQVLSMALNKGYSFIFNFLLVCINGTY
jgi:hypothetical protein